MKSISFKNFRRFTDFPEFKFGDITLLVGGNNAGKSTLLKAINLLVSNLKQIKCDPVHSHGMGSASKYVIKMPKFDLQAIGVYSQVHNIHNSEPIQFSIHFGNSSLKNFNYRFELVFNLSTATGNSKELDIDRICLNDQELAISYIVNRNGDNCEFEIEWVDFYDHTYNSEKSIDKFIYGAKKEIAGLHNCEEYVYDSYLDQIIDERISDSLPIAERERAQRITEALNKNQKRSFIFKEYGILPEYFESNLGLARLFESITLLYIDNNDRNEDGFGTIEMLDEYLKKRIKDSVLEFQKSIDNLLIIDTPNNPIERAKAYIKGLHLSFSLIDKFYKADNRKREFFKGFLEPFGIATDFRICATDDIAYCIEVLDLDGQWINIQELGTGSLRIVFMLMYMLTSPDRLIYLEEPEQNLHPAVQSKLADLLFQINKEFGLKFIIETHSEYLIRRTQVLVAEMNIENEDELGKQNPFKVYYFPANDMPYDMKYLPTGRFENKFGEGFFDEASTAALTISKLERRKKNG